MVFNQVVLQAPITHLSHQPLGRLAGLAVIVFNDQVSHSAVLKSDHQVLAQTLGLDHLRAQAILGQVFQLVLGIALRLDDHLATQVANASRHLNGFG